MDNRTFAGLVAGGFFIIIVSVFLGYLVGSPAAGVALGVIAIIAILANAPLIVPAPAAPAAPARQPIFNLSSGWIKVLIVVAIIASLPFLAYLMHPPLAKALEERGQNNLVSLTNAVKKSNLKSEAKAGTFGKITKTIPVFDANGKKYTYGRNEIVLRAGDKVMASNLDGLPATSSMQGLTRVIPENNDGLFCNENALYVPSDAIEWGR